MTDYVVYRIRSRWLGSDDPVFSHGPWFWFSIEVLKSLGGVKGGINNNSILGKMGKIRDNFGRGFRGRVGEGGGEGGEGPEYQGYY